MDVAGGMQGPRRVSCRNAGCAEQWHVLLYELTELNRGLLAGVNMKINLNLIL